MEVQTPLCALSVTVSHFSLQKHEETCLGAPLQSKVSETPGREIKKRRKEDFHWLKEEK